MLIISQNVVNIKRKVVVVVEKLSREKQKINLRKRRVINKNKALKGNSLIQNKKQQSLNLKIRLQDQKFGLFL